jgi:SAM-dependent methyltransferase
MLTGIQFRILKMIHPGGPRTPGHSAYEGKSKLAVLLGDQFFDHVLGKTVIDLGCGDGTEAVEMAQRGAKQVIGLDIREEVLQKGRQRALAAGVQDRCLFASSIAECADVIVSIDSFEHFADPAEVLRVMNSLLWPDGEIFISFGPTWYHPLGGHLFSVFPWSHLIFSEKALMRWRSTFMADGARRFSEVSGGLNQMTIKKFERLVEASDLRLAALEPVPITKLRPFHNRLTREFTTAVVRCRLNKRTRTAYNSRWQRQTAAGCDF